MIILKKIKFVKLKNNAVKNNAILTEEISETLPAKITHTIDYEATEIDDETGLDQDLKVTASVVYYG